MSSSDLVYRPFRTNAPNHALQRTASGRYAPDGSR